MRINVYAEELKDVGNEPDRVMHIDKQVVASLRRHHAIQILVAHRVPHGEDDDDTSGIKFWYYSEYERGLLVKMFEKALEELAKPQARGE